MASERATLRYPYPIEDPAVLRQQARTIGNLGQLLLDTHAEVNDDKLKLADSWRSDTAATAVSDVQTLSTDMQGDSTSLADAAAAVTTYVGHLEEARGDIDSIRRRYDEADAQRWHDRRNPPEWVNSRFEHEEWDLSCDSELETKAKALDGERTTVLATLTERSRPAVRALDTTLERFVGANPPTSQSLGEVAFEKASTDLDLTSDSGYEFQLRQAGLLSGPSPDGYYAEWLANAERQGVDPGVIVQIARDHGITPEDFAVLDGAEKITDPQGKSFFLLPTGISGDDARKAVLMTYILNAGTDYGEGTEHDFPIEPYSSAEVQRIIDRQQENGWTYRDDVGFVHGNGGRLATTPNGILMGLGGNWLQDKYSLNGGTTWGDIFMLNIDDPADAAQTLRDAVRSGKGYYTFDDGSIGPGQLDLDRLLHHEERHSQQWADLGYAEFIATYAAESAGTWLINLGPWEYDNWFERDAGLHDGGYH